MPEFQVIEFEIKVPSPGRRRASTITVTGVVVNCRPEKDAGQYRIWIKFLDLKESIRNRIECVAKSAKHLCPYCENY
jgi:hypothetical protein